VRRPSGNGSSIVYELGGELWVYDTSARVSHRVPVEIRADAPEVRQAFVKVDSLMTSVDVSPNGARALVVARGDVFSVPRKDGVTRNLTRSSGSREKGRGVLGRRQEGRVLLRLQPARSSSSSATRSAREWPSGSPHTRAATGTPCAGPRTGRGSPTPTRPSGSTSSRWPARRSPSSTGPSTRSWTSHRTPSRSATSPGRETGRFITYSKMNADLVTQIWITEVASGAKHCVSSGLYNDFGPVFSRDGEQPVLRLQPALRPDLLRLRVGDGVQEGRRHLRPDVAPDGEALLGLKDDEDTAAKAEHEPAARHETRDEGPPTAKPETPAKPVHIDFEVSTTGSRSCPLPRGQLPAARSRRRRASSSWTPTTATSTAWTSATVPPWNLHAFIFKEREVKVREAKRVRTRSARTRS